MSWNSEGLNKRYKQKEIAIYLKENKVKLVGIVETRAKEHNASKISRKIAPRWEFETNYASAVSGRVWILWDSAVYHIKSIQQEAQLLHCNMVSRNQAIDRNMTAVYGYNTIEMRKELWQQLAGISQKVSKPWIIWGDFNSILCPQDRLYSTAVTSMEIKDFAECVQNLMLNELPWKGDYYTWANNKDIRGKLKVLNETEFKGITMKIEQAREDLKKVQTKISAHYTDALASEEKNILC
ncbi:uncharacterized protein LOC142171925 [Nicotiana tabacum]|uniref:Uncharacterized protein LOC142171925 n=1 Tax=Nicotiana tabacum TaxID=4097 RepID=A0AC58T3H5_TOBAC